jgi:geranylgeranyl diphosphate synthase type II
MMDIQREGMILSEKELRQIHKRKTAAMIERPAPWGGRGPGYGKADGVRQRLRPDIGLAFQVRDDVLDCFSTVEELGKTIGSDEANHKSTFATIHGSGILREPGAAKTESAKESCAPAFADTAFLEWLADGLAAPRK